LRPLLVFESSFDTYLSGATQAFALRLKVHCLLKPIPIDLIPNILNRLNNKRRDIAA
jgi:hypothetical protein